MHFNVNLKYIGLKVVKRPLVTDNVTYKRNVTVLK
jgi:hypothetical protein